MLGIPSEALFTFGTASRDLLRVRSRSVARSLIPSAAKDLENYAGFAGRVEFPDFDGCSKLLLRLELRRSVIKGPDCKRDNLVKFCGRRAISMTSRRRNSADENWVALLRRSR